MPGSYDQLSDRYSYSLSEYECNDYINPSDSGHATATVIGAGAVPIQASPLPAHSGGIPGVIPNAGRNAVAPPISVASGSSGNPAIVPTTQQPTPGNDSLDQLLQRYPVMWQGLLALKNDQAAVQMHFVHGNPGVAGSSLPSNSDGTTPPLRIAQRMRLEPAQIDGVARKMQVSIWIIFNSFFLFLRVQRR